MPEQFVFVAIDREKWFYETIDREILDSLYTRTAFVMFVPTSGGEALALLVVNL